MDATTNTADRIPAYYAAATEQWFASRPGTLTRADIEADLDRLIRNYAKAHGITEADAEARLIDLTAR